MLRQLSITNFGLIESAEVEFGSGLQVVTGETGVGKSLLFNSLAILSGARANTDWIRRDADEARVVGFFAIEGSDIARTIDEMTGLESADEGLRIERRLKRRGRHRAFINGEELPLSMVRRVGSLLVEMHGQRAQLSLLDPRSQLDMIDRFSGVGPKRAEYGERYHRAMKLARELDAIEGERRDRHDRRMFLGHVVSELEDADLRVGEREELERDLQLLEERDRVLLAVDGALVELHDTDDSVLDRLGIHSRELGEIASLHAGIGEFVESIDASRAALDEGLRSLRQVRDDLDRDPARLDELRSRSDRLAELEERYRRAGDELVSYRDEVQRELAEIVGDEEDFPARVAELDALIDDLRKRARSLTRRRKSEGKKLGSRIAESLADLGMAQATLEVSVTPLPVATSELETTAESETVDNPETADESETPTGSQVAKLQGLDANGADRVELIFGPNPGEPLRPLRSIASGGELSRVMLSIESVLANADRVPILVFDEIDAGVGGRLGTEIGRKLREIGGVHQVFCVTHLPQVASFGNTHFHVSKKVSKGRTRTAIEPLSGDVRERELAAMIRGSAKSKTSIAQAREMLQEAVGDG